MKAKKTSRPATVAGATVSPPPTREQIQVLAHAIWTDRGCPYGCDVEIWLEAERQLSKSARANTPGTGISEPGESVDPDRSDAARVDRELDRIVSPPEQRSPTSL